MITRCEERKYNDTVLSARRQMSRQMHQTILVVCLCTVTIKYIIGNLTLSCIGLQTLGIGTGCYHLLHRKEVDMRAVSPSTAVATLQMATVGVIRLPFLHYLGSVCLLSHCRIICKHE